MNCRNLYVIGHRATVVGCAGVERAVVETQPSGFSMYRADAQGQSASVSPADGLSLSTAEWNYSAWLVPFFEALRENWTAPYAYRVGVTSGYATISFSVDPLGKMTNVRCVECHAHISLTESTVATLKSLSGQYRLPADFPEGSLSVTATILYPHQRKKGQQPN